MQQTGSLMQWLVESESGSHFVLMAALCVTSLAVDPMVFPPSYSEAPTLSVMVFGDGALGR